MEMPSLTGKRVHIGTYVPPKVLKKIEEARSAQRRMSRSHWLEDAILEKLERDTSASSFSEPTQSPRGHHKTV